MKKTFDAEIAVREVQEGAGVACANAWKEARQTKNPTSFICANSILTCGSEILNREFI
jgi:hypothetical protein